MKSNPLFNLAKSKLEKSDVREELYGCLNYPEILALLQAGWVLQGSNAYKVDYLQYLIERGDKGSEWTYWAVV